VREDTAGIRTIADEEFAEALAWATAEVRARASLLRASGEFGAERYEVFDALVRSDIVGDRPVSDECWTFVLDRLVAASGVNVGLAAVAAGKREVAEAAWRKVGQSQQAEVASVGLFYLGVLCGLLGRSDDAIAVYDEVIARFADDPTPAVREQIARALVNKGVTLGELGRSADAIAVYDEVIARFAEDPPPALREPVAMPLVNKGATLGQLGRSDDAIAVYDEALTHFRGLYEATPTPATHRDLAVTLNELGQALLAEGDVSLACTHLKKARALAVDEPLDIIADSAATLIAQHCHDVR
jgi:tetratricopeptide (TPR) repeat protein